MQPATAAHLYLERQIKHKTAPAHERALCCDLVHPSFLTSHQRGFRHVANYTRTPYRVLRHEVNKLSAVWTVERILVNSKV